MEDIWSWESQVPSLPRRLVWCLALVVYTVVSTTQWGLEAQHMAGRVTPLTPARWTYDIWIFLLAFQAAAVVYFLLPSGYDPDGDKQRYVHAVGGAWAAWWACQIFWISLLRAASPAATWLALLCALVALAVLCSALKTLHVLRRRFGSPSSPLLYVLYFFPTSVAAAWTAVLAALTLLASLAGRAGAREALWASAVLALALGAAGSAAVLLSRDTALGLAFVWALLGSYEASPAPIVQRCALLAIAALLVACLLSVLRRRASAPAADPLDDPEARIALRSSSLEQ